MKILFVAPYVPNLIHVRPYNLLRALAARGHQITLAALAAGAGEQADARALASVTADQLLVPLDRLRAMVNLGRGVFSRDPLQSWHSWLPEFAGQLARLVRQQSFDVVHVEHLRGVRYGLDLQARFPRLPVVWDSVDCISLLFKLAAAQSQSLSGRLMTLVDLARTRRYEARLVRQFRHILVTSPVDRAALLTLPHPQPAESEIHTIANGVDLEYFQPGPAEARSAAGLVISGKMSYHANVSMVLYFMRHILPLVWASRPDVTLTVVGKDPPGDILALTQDPRIRVTGAVTDMRPFIQQAAVAVAPILYGVGIQNKVLEAMACATPVVCTPQAVAALPARPDEDLLVGDSPQSFAQAVLELLNDPQRRQSVGIAGREYVEKQHNWNQLAGRVETIYRTAQKERTV